MSVRCPACRSAARPGGWRYGLLLYQHTVTPMCGVAALLLMALVVGLHARHLLPTAGLFVGVGVGPCLLGLLLPREWVCPVCGARWGHGARARSARTIARDTSPIRATPFGEADTAQQERV